MAEYRKSSQRKQVCCFLLGCLCLYRQLEGHTARAAQKVLQVYVPVDGSSSLLSLSTALVVRNTGTYTASQLGDGSLTVPFAVPALTRLGAVRSGLPVSFRGWVLPFLQGWKSWVIGHTVLAFSTSIALEQLT